jgi:hypothetical protein
MKIEPLERVDRSIEAWNGFKETCTGTRVRRIKVP